MKDFKFFRGTDRVFSDFMDQLDDYHLGGIRQPYFFLTEVAVICASMVDFRNFKHENFGRRRDATDLIHSFIRGTKRYRAYNSIDSLQGMIVHEVIVTDRMNRRAEEDEELQFEINRIRYLANLR